MLRNLGSTTRNEVRRLPLRLIVPDDADVTLQATVPFLDAEDAWVGRLAAVDEQDGNSYLPVW